MTARTTPFRASFAFAAAALGLAVAVGALGSAPARAAEAPVGLSTAGAFAVLAGTTVTNTGSSSVGGDLGVSPGTSVTGFPPGIVHDGAIHSADALAGQAKADAATAYNDAAGRANSATITADLGGQSLTSGVYTGTTLGLTGTVTLQGDADSVFIFRSASTLITAPGSSVSLTGGVQACHVFWQVGSSATLDTTTAFIGTVLAHVSITANHAATVDGRLLADTGAVTLDDNTITAPSCATTPPGTGTATGSAPGTGTSSGTAPGTGGASTAGSSGVSATSSAATTQAAIPTKTTISASPDSAGTTTVTAVVTAPAGTPTGAVNLSVNGKVHGASALDSRGRAVFELATSASTGVTVRARYNGAPHFAPSTSGSLQLPGTARGGALISADTSLANTGFAVLPSGIGGLLAIVLGCMTLIAARRVRAAGKHRL